MAPHSNAVNDALESGAFKDSEHKASVTKFYTAFLRGFSHDEVIPALPRLRERLRRDLAEANRAPAAEVSLWLRQFLFADLKRLVADDKQSIATRVNAGEMIADMNQAEVVITLGKVTAMPAPWREATPYLLKTFDDPQMPDAVRASALRGLHRHARLGLADPADGPPLLAAMLKAAQETKAPQGSSVEAHQWTRRRAIEIVGLLKDAGAAKLLVTLLGDAELSLALRCEAARSLGLLSLSPADPSATPATARSLGDLAVAVAEIVTDQRQLHEYLDGVATGLNGPDATAIGGIRAATPAADAQLANGLFAPLDRAIKKIGPGTTRLGEEQLTEAREALAKGLRGLLPAAEAKERPVGAPK
jgi:hypothetical protein